MPAHSDDWIRDRAYALWVEEGHPTGRDRDHWEAAQREFSRIATVEPKIKKRPVAAVKSAEAAEKKTTRATKPKKTGDKTTKAAPGLKKSSKTVK